MLNPFMAPLRFNFVFLTVILEKFATINVTYELY